MTTLASPSPALYSTTPSLAAPIAPPRRSAWLTTLYYTHGWDHGSHLRTFAIAREWVRRGAEVHFIGLRFERDDPAKTHAYLERLRDERIITGFSELILRHPTVRGKLAHAALVPRLRDLILGPERRAIVRELDQIAKSVNPDLFIYTARHLLFAIPHLRRYAPVTVDWGDFYGLYHARLLRAVIERRDWQLAAHSLWAVADNWVTERHYSRRANTNVFVSPVDAAALARYAGSTARTTVVPNGIRDQPSAPNTVRVPGRIIFTGVMDFWPNHLAALWFIERVLPLLVAKRPDVRFVVAGSNPRPELRAHASKYVEVTGYVDDIRAEITRSALYVAPLTAGSGFKNKVVEALAAGTNVVGTSLAFEFLAPELRALFAFVDDPEQLATAILAALDDPERNAANVKRFWELAGDEFDWTNVAGRFSAAVARR